MVARVIIILFSSSQMVRSCRENPGPCGAGACVYLPGQEECVKLKNPVSKLAIIERVRVLVNHRQLVIIVFAWKPPNLSVLR